MKFDALILDPPRTGLGDTLKFVVKLKAKKIVYVSCDPATFSREAQILCASGYTLKVIQPLDMFPHTPHVEVVGLFVLPV
ncbi:MAG: tRNA (Uracil-5-) -methyltransferase [uncultured bacterium]|nr:MAG: tRNA (Uracil-5-) -methyltransferase [uncultured bacterium]